MNQREKEIVEKVREKINQLIKDYNKNILFSLNIDERKFFELPFWRREKYVELTQEFSNQILSIENLAIIDNEAELPPSCYHPLLGSKDFEERFAGEIGYAEAQQDMKSQGWRKVIDVKLE